MEGKKFLIALVALCLIGLILLYSLSPIEDINFSTEINPSFTLGNNTVLMQFYENMRFPESEISYSIDQKCSLQKKTDMRRAFTIIENLTILNFEEVNSQGEIFVSCQDENRVEDGMFIAGEGGPTKIISGQPFNVIFSGKILLIRDSKCSDPTVAMHELLHVLGFNHSDNPQNLMYPVSKCSQTIGDEIINEIDRLYSFPSYPDLFFENASATKEGRYLNLNVTVRNGGLKESPPTKIILYNEDKKLKEIDLKELEIGIGMTISLNNLDVKIAKIENLKIVIESEFEELTKENNKIILSSIDN